MKRGDVLWHPIVTCTIFCFATDVLSYLERESARAKWELKLAQMEAEDLYINWEEP